MDKQTYIQMAKDLNLKTISGIKEYAKRLNDKGVKGYDLIYNVDLGWALDEMNVSLGKMHESMRRIDSEKTLIEKYGDLAKEYIEVFDKCLELHLDHHYFDGCMSRGHNSFVLQMGNDKLKDYPTLYSISTFDDNYNCTIQIENYHNYKEKFVHLTDFGVLGIKMVTKLLKSKVEEELEYREKNAWQGELNLNTLVEQVKPLFPNLTIKVANGKRQCDGNVDPYDAIVVYDGRAYVGSLTLGYNEYKGVVQLSCRVPLCGECGCDVNNDNVILNISDYINYMIS